MKSLRDSALSIAPIAVIVLLLHFTGIASMPNGMLASFFIGTALLILGMTLFNVGVNRSMVEMGSYLGASMSKSKKLWVPIAVSFLIGFIVTIAEPDVTVLSEQVPAIPTMTLIITVSLGVGIFLMVAVMRTILNIPLKYVLIAVYALIFLLVVFVDKTYLSVAFDAGGVATGPITVPFILAVGIGVSSVRASKDSEKDSFGYVALCAAGPILAVLILGLVFPSSSAESSVTSIPNNAAEVFALLSENLLSYLASIAIALVPIFIFFLIYQSIKLKLPIKTLVKIAVGMLYTYFGLVLFLTGASMGFLMTGSFVGSAVVSSSSPWALLPIGMIAGICIVVAEPGVHVLIKQVEEETGGAVKKSVLLLFLAAGVSVAVGLSVVRMLTGISILWFLVPCYLVGLILTFFVPDVFTGIAFDSGGVASGALTSTFLLALSLGAVEAAGGNLMTDAFGLIALVSTAPFVAIEILGLVYRAKTKRTSAESPKPAADPYEIYEF